MITNTFMVPHPPLAVHEIGKGEENKIIDSIHAYEEMAERIAEIQPDTVIVISPHATMYRDWFAVSAGDHAYGDFSRFRAGSVSFEKEYDRELTGRLSELLKEEGIPGGCAYEGDPMLDHGTMVPLYYLDQKYTDYRLVRIGLSGQSLPMHYRLGMAIQKTVSELHRKAVIIASGDLAHCQKADGPYGYRPEGPEYDEKIMKTMGNAAFNELFEYDPAFLDACMECGHRSFVIMAGCLDRRSVRAEVISHEATFGVGYGFVFFEDTGYDPGRNFLDQYEEAVRNRNQSDDPYVKLAYRAVNAWVKNRERISTEGVPEELLQEKAGVFVSIHEFNELRGCIGTILPVYPNAAEEIIRNGISACSRDPRFDPITEEELPYLEINVDVLKTPERITDKSMLDVKKYGVICSLPNGKKGLLLPDLDGVDTIEEQISIACRKGGIDPEDEDLILERFEVVRHV